MAEVRFCLAALVPFLMQAAPTPAASVLLDEHLAHQAKAHSDNWGKK